MATWQQLADQLKTDPALEQLDEAQVEALVDVLMLVMHADETVAFMEEAELEHMLFELPWVEDKQEKVEAHLKAARAKIEAVDDEAGFRAMVDSAAKVITDGDVRSKVYRMAVTIAEADMQIHPEEHKVLTWLAEEFEIPESKRAIQA